MTPVNVSFGTNRKNISSAAVELSGNNSFLESPIRMLGNRFAMSYWFKAKQYGGVLLSTIDSADIGINIELSLQKALPPVASTIYFGRSGLATAPYFNGFLDDIRIYSQEITRAEIDLLGKE